MAQKISLPKLEVPPPARLRPGLDVLRWYFAPEYLHFERADARRPTLFVGNHSLYGVLDVLLFVDGLYRERGIVLRSLADRNHFKVPLWRDFVVQTGAVQGTRANCAALMRRGEHILVFPGGAREVFKHKGEAYQLIWKERFGFVQLAIEHGYTITPYATAAGAGPRAHGAAAAREALLPGRPAARHGAIPRTGRRPGGAATREEPRAPVADAVDRRSTRASGAGGRAGRAAGNAEPTLGRRGRAAAQRVARAANIRPRSALTGSGYFRQSPTRRATSTSWVFMPSVVESTVSL